MIAHIITNPTRPVVNETLYWELDRQGIDAKFWEPVYDSNDVVRSISLSHKQIVRFAIEHHLPEICIMEEDVMFPAPDGWQYFQRNKPDHFDLYLAGAYGLNRQALIHVAEGNGAVPIHNFAGLHCYIINHTYYERFLAMPENKHIDDQPGLGKFYVCAPFAALQHPGWSSTARRPVDYNCDKSILPPECIYYGNKSKETNY
jgi:hypothetical protein